MQWWSWALAFAFIATAPSAIAQPADNLPIEACADEASCALEIRHLMHDAAEIFDAAQRSIHRMSPVDFEQDEEHYRIRAAFRVLFFLDDMHVAIVPTSNGCTMHVRSESRSGVWDAGVNRRRVERFFRTLERVLEEAASTAEP